MPRFEVFLLIIDKRALGAEQNKILWMVLSEAMQLVVVGIAIGVPAALAASRLVASFLYGLRPDDPLTISLSTLLMSCIAGLAGFLPAWRATKVDPMVALRYE